MPSELIFGDFVVPRYIWFLFSNPEVHTSSRKWSKKHAILPDFRQKNHPSGKKKTTLSAKKNLRPISNRRSSSVPLRVLSGLPDIEMRTPESPFVPNPVLADWRDLTRELSPRMVLPKPEVPVNKSSRSVLGSLHWLAMQTRMDLAYPVNQLSLIQTNPTVLDLKALNKVVKEAKSRSNLKLVYSKVNNKCLVVEADASFARNYDGSTSGGYIVLFADPTKHHTEFFHADDNKSIHCFPSSVVEWKSQKLKRITRSTLASETLALSDAIDSAVFVRTLWCELFNENLYLHVYSDSKSLVQASHSHKSGIAEKMLLVNLAAIRQYISNGTIASFRHIPSKLNLADFFTKDISNKERLIAFLRTQHLRLPFDHL